MSSLNRRIIYSLLTVVFILLVGMVAMLSVAHQRSQRFEDLTIDLQRHLSIQENQIRRLQAKLQHCDTIRSATRPDTSWANKPAVSPVMTATR